MWARYVLKRDAIRVKRKADTEPFRAFDPPILSTELVDRYPEIFANPEHDINEVYLFHGTFVRATMSIAKNDFRIDLAGSSTGTMYGAGAYLGESITKADEYAKDEPEGYYDGVFATLLCRACMGKLYYTTKRDEEAGGKVGSGTYDSTCGDRSRAAGTFRELVIYDNDQLYPEYIVVYQRVHARDDAEQLKRSLSHPFHMEIPVYWANCFRDLSGDPFDERVAVTNVTVDALQRLVTACADGEQWEVVSARRVENSKLWREYVAYKVGLRRALGAQRCTPVSEIGCCPGFGHVLTTDHLLREPLEQCISIGNIEVRLNEHLLWHATSRDSAEAIAKSNFQIATSGTAVSGLRYGPGAYFAESLGKALAYSMDEAGAKYVLLCRVACGEFYYTEGTERDATDRARQCGKAAVLANPQQRGPREFVVFDAEQVYPEFFLELRRAC